VRYRFPAFIAASFMTAVPACAQDATGEWLVSEGTAQIRIVSCGSSLWGVVSWEQTPGGRDTHNPDPSKRGRPTLGMPILLNMQPADPGQWEGEVYNAENGRTYDATITLGETGKLHIEGCVMGFLCGGEDWTRAQPRSAASGRTAHAAASDPATASPAVVCSRVGAGRSH